MQSRLFQFGAVKWLTFLVNKVLRFHSLAIGFRQLGTAKKAALRNRGWGHAFPQHYRGRVVAGERSFIRVSNHVDL
jgi:hypothetical protein